MKKQWMGTLAGVILLTLGLVLGIPGEVSATSLIGNPNISFSPDREAFTTDAGERDFTRYGVGHPVETGVLSSLRNLIPGEHKYKVQRVGIVPIGKWVVKHEPGQCIHDSYLNENQYHGLAFGRQKCLSQYKSGWYGYCADCGEPVADLLFYMDEETAKSIKDINNTLHYYYLCPNANCNNLEQGCPIPVHMCTDISWNQYFIVYMPNLGDGFMAPSMHMWNNKTVFEGQDVTPETKLRKNIFKWKGYSFAGWNTKADGSGDVYEDEAEIYNLTSVQNAKIMLYAQWEKCESTLEINPAGGTYLGSKDTSLFRKGYHEQYTADPSSLVPPVGYTVRFEINGGEPVADILTKKRFKLWSISFPFSGNLKENTYTYGEVHNAIDTLTARYEDQPFMLPPAKKAGEFFGGWYRDSNCSVPAGQAGEHLTVTENTTLYAKWTDLVLTSRDNYVAYGGTGAVDLSWQQNDGAGNIYRLYQSGDLKTWNALSTQEEGEIPLSVNYFFGATGSEKQLEVPYTGLYTLRVSGSQGRSYGVKNGGAGGEVKASVWLSKGEILTCNVGMQTGYPDGGTGSPYGNGGGSTVISSNRKGILLIAGGGGGASNIFDGGEGGSVFSNIPQSRGGNGSVGGGGGYRGGTAGEAVVHTHTASCRHSHIGNPNTYGGCYTGITQIFCGTASYRSWGFWDNNGDGYCDQCMPLNIKKEQHPYNSHGAWQCNTCGGAASASGHYKTGYALTCRFNEKQLLCAYQYLPEPGGIISAYPAYGGSNYINTMYAVIQADRSGVRNGDGEIHILLQKVEYIHDVEQKAVKARDMEKPHSIDRRTIEKKAVGGEKIQISWEKPQDRGSIYYHKVESYHGETTKKICESNITVNTLTSGISGYYYAISRQKDMVLVPDESDWIAENYVVVEVTEKEEYFHVAAVDVAGNISETLHVKIGKEDEEVAWPISTDKLKIFSKNQSIYPSEEPKTYYVKADGATPFDLSFMGYLEHEATPGYQINYSIFSVVAEGFEQNYRITTPSSKSIQEGEIVLPASELKKSVEGYMILSDGGYTISTRSNHCRNLKIYQRFLMPREYDNIKMRVMPVAGAEFNKGTVYSQEEEDIENSLYLIGDGRPPEIYGTELLEELAELDWKRGEILMDLTCADEGSGVGEFYVEVINRDNFISRKFYADSNGHVKFALMKMEDFMFHGKFDIYVHAVDLVGNERVLTFHRNEIDLTVSITRMLEPHAPVFKRGETGILHIKGMGYVERIEIEIMEPFFPEGRVFVYTEPEYIQQEDVEFFIPLNAMDSSYTITVRAFKEGKYLEAYARAGMAEEGGTVLEDFRRRILYR